MANKKINDLAAVGAVADNMQLETDIGGTTANKITATQTKDYVNAGKTGGKTIEGGTAVSENLVLDSTSNATKGEVQVASGSNLVVNDKVLTDTLSEKTATNGIAIEFSAGSGKFYDHTALWFSMSGSGIPDDGTNFYIPYSSSDGWYIGYGMAATDEIYMGTLGEFVCTGDAKVTINSIKCRPQLSAPLTMNGAIYYDVGDAEFKFRENGQWLTLGATSIWERIGTTISPINAGDDLDIEGGTIYGNNIASANLLLESTSNVTKGEVQIADGSKLHVNTTNYETLVTDNNDIPNKKYVDDQIGGVDEFSELTDVTGAYTTSGALYNVNATTNGLQETTTVLSELAPDSFTIARGTATLNVIASCTINQNLSSSAAVTFKDITVSEKFFESVALIEPLDAVDTIPSDFMNVPIVGNGAVTLTSNPQIAAGINGQCIRLIGTDDTNTVTVVDGNGLALDNGQSFTVGQNDIIEFVFYNSLWIETTRKDN